MNSVGKVDLTLEQQQTAEQIGKIYSAFGVKIGQLTGFASSPEATRYEFALLPDTKLAKITKFTDDLSLLLSVPRVKITCPLPDKSAFAIEIPSWSKNNP